VPQLLNSLPHHQEGSILITSHQRACPTARGFKPLLNDRFSLGLLPNFNLCGWWSKYCFLNQRWIVWVVGTSVCPGQCTLSFHATYKLPCGMQSWSMFVCCHVSWWCINPALDQRETSKLGADCAQPFAESWLQTEKIKMLMFWWWDWTLQFSDQPRRGSYIEFKHSGSNRRALAMKHIRSSWFSRSCRPYLHIHMALCTYCHPMISDVQNE